MGGWEGGAEISGYANCILSIHWNFTVHTYDFACHLRVCLVVMPRASFPIARAIPACNNHIPGVSDPGVTEDEDGRTDVAHAFTYPTMNRSPAGTTHPYCAYVGIEDHRMTSLL